jgi:hypothetical protein
MKVFSGEWKAHPPPRRYHPRSGGPSGLGRPFGPREALPASTRGDPAKLAPFAAGPPWSVSVTDFPLVSGLNGIM